MPAAGHAQRTLRVSFLFVVLHLLGCVSAQDGFLLSNLDGQAKARALVEEGAQQYQIQLVRRGDLTKVDTVREYFTMALRYDSSNLLAARYRDLVDNFRATRLNQALHEARGYLARPKRREEEDYALCAAIQTALRIDPGNVTAAGLARDTEGIRQRLIAQYLARAKSAMSVPSSAPAAEHEAAVVESYRNVSRVLTLDPGNTMASGQMTSLKQELDRIAMRHADTAGRLIAAGQFEGTQEQVSQLEDLDRKLGGVMGSRAAAIRYTMDYQWARSLYARREYIQAETRVNEAISLMRTDEALSLRKKIAEPAAQAEQQVSFDASLQQIDGFIDQGNLVTAASRLEALARRTDDQQGLDLLLDSRRDKIRSFLAPMYEKAVQDYRNEDFKDAVDLLQTIVSIDVGYEQAGDYLDKAIAKEKLVEQY